MVIDGDRAGGHVERKQREQNKQDKTTHAASKERENERNSTCLPGAQLLCTCKLLAVLRACLRYSITFEVVNSMALAEAFDARELREGAQQRVNFNREQRKAQDQLRFLLSPRARRRRLRARACDHFSLAPRTLGSPSSAAGRASTP